MYNNIQLLRGVSALIVFLHHIRFHYAAMGGKNSLIIGISEFGYVGVDVFFVISGFVMAYLINEGADYDRSFSSFVGRRLIRIFSWYWPWLLVSMVCLYFFEKDRYLEISAIRSLFLSSILIKDLTLPVSWSLSHEILFYMSTSFLLLINKRLATKIVILTVFFQVVANFFFVYREGSISSFIFSPYNLEYLMGFLLYQFKDKIYEYFDSLILLGLSVFFIYLGVVNGVTSTTLRVPTFGVGAFFLVCLAVLTEENGSFKARSVFVSMSNASFTIYLAHLAFISLLFNSGVLTWIAQFGGVTLDIGFFLLIALVVVLCCILNQFLEKPLLRVCYRIFGFGTKSEIAMCRQVPSINT